MFSKCKTLEELKKAYHKAAMASHPDLGGDLEQMKEVNNQYDKYFELLKNKHANHEGKIFEKENPEVSDYFKNIIEKLIHFEGISIEIIGCFVWVSGNTKEYKDQLKEMGFKWHSKKMCWYLSPEDYKKFGKKQYSLDEIRLMYGSTEVKTNKQLKLSAAV